MDTYFTRDVTEGHLLYKRCYRGTPTLQEMLQRDTYFTRDVTEGHRYDSESVVSVLVA